ncbi:unnamed protein product [Clavelina lepadiformis]|uniref:Uncharacterized protein n=1 Tax=Clavelina lepadiformis TaxID=159417 RepID=A0ABP0GJ86_CLALP
MVTFATSHRDLSGKDYTFTPDTSSPVHAEEVSRTQSELHYRRKYANKGKSWQADESPAMGHFKDAQRLVDNIDYKRSAKEINARGTSAAMEHTPTSLQQKKAQEILDDRRYKADYEKTVKGRGMTFDLHVTPTLEHVKHAEDIKSDKLNKEQYETSVKGKPAVSMDMPHFIQAQKANDLISENYRENKGRSLAMFDTPEMRRVKENQRALSEVEYKSDLESMRGKQTSVVFDTPDMIRVRQNTHNFSSIKYKDSHSKGRSVATMLDTPEMRTARENKKNFSQIKYQEDHKMTKGRAIQVVDDFNLRRVRQATKISSDLEYKGLKNKQQERTPAALNFVPQQQQVMRTTQKSYQHSPDLPQSTRQEVIRSEPLRRWRRNPGSIFDYDPSDYETDAEYKQENKLQFCFRRTLCGEVIRRQDE